MYVTAGHDVHSQKRVHCADFGPCATEIFYSQLVILRSQKQFKWR